MFVNSQIAHGGKLLDFFTGSSSSSANENAEQSQAPEVSATEESIEQQIDANDQQTTTEVSYSRFFKFNGFILNQLICFYSPTGETRAKHRRNETNSVIFPKHF